MSCQAILINFHLHVLLLIIESGASLTDWTRRMQSMKIDQSISINTNYLIGTYLYFRGPDQ